MAPLLRHQELHRSSKLSNVPLDLHKNFSIDPPDSQIICYLNKAGFQHVASIGKFKINPSLVTAMVERWRPETHTFHLPVGECTITLEDVALQLGLTVDGCAVSGYGYTKEGYDYVCQKLLGKVPRKEDRKGNEVKLKWLEEEFGVVPKGAHKDVVKAHSRAYMLRLIGGYIIPDKSSNRVHLKYLPLLESIKNVKKYSWGSACLATLYKEMCRAVFPSSSSMGGCTLLLQSWVWYRMPFLAPSVSRSIEWPLAKR